MTIPALRKPRSFIGSGKLDCWKKCFVVLLLILIGVVVCMHQLNNLDVLASTAIVNRVKNMLLSNFTFAANISLSSSNTSLVDRHLTLEDIYISVKSSKKFHEKRLQILLDTWIQTALNQVRKTSSLDTVFDIMITELTYIFTDEDDKNVTVRLPKGHVINTKCRRSHSRTDLCCKFAIEFEHYMKSGKSWFCHVDDDNYLNVDRLLTMLRNYDPSELWYLGRASLDHPVTPPERPKLKHVKFWFATLGAGVCLSKALAKKMIKHAGDRRFNNACDHIAMPDDCTLGYIINYLIGVNLTTVNLFHSHFENLKEIKDPENQITLGFGGNVISIKGFDVINDPTRLKSLHCKLHPDVAYCSSLKQNKDQLVSDTVNPMPSKFLWSTFLEQERNTRSQRMPGVSVG